MFKQSSRQSLQAVIVTVHELAAKDRARMFELMQSAYDAVTERQFLADLEKKDAVILLKDPAHAIQGFSTLASLRVQIDGKTLRGIFSGDTVIAERYWGQRALGKAFLRYLFLEKLKAPFAPLYWLLISKGYKTYLMMANNFAEHYPRYEHSTPTQAQQILDAFYATLYPGTYDPQTGLIETVGEAYHLKPGIAPIANALVESNPRIAFFAARNPRWRTGAELACLARMTLRMPFVYALKGLMKDRVIRRLQRISRLVFSLPEKRDQDLR